jgi:hypothetical protein
VDISFTQVPAYQVDSGRDQANQKTTGAKSILGGAANQNVNPANASGANAPSVQGTLDPFAPNRTGLR